MRLDIFHVYDSLLRSSQEIHRLPQAHPIQEVGISCVHSESVWTYARRFVNFFSFFLVDQARFDHPPTDGSLKTSKSKHRNQHVSQMRLNVALCKEVGHWSKEYDSDRASDDSVKPFPEEDVFEARDVHAGVLVLVDPLWRFLVLLKFFLPLFLANWRQNSVRFPSDHRKSRLC